MNLCNNSAYIRDSYTRSEMVCHQIEEIKRQALCIFVQCVTFFIYIKNAGKDRTVFADRHNSYTFLRKQGYFNMEGGLGNECYNM